MKITPKTNIKEMMDYYLDKNHEIMCVMIGYGLFCFGCSSAEYESIGDGAKGHGMSDADVKSLISELNNAVKG